MAGATKLEIYQYALRHLADARLALISDDVECRFALDDAWPRAVPYVLGLCGWRFALKTAALAAGGAAMPGYSNSYALPADCLLVHGLFRTAGTNTGRECPFDLREQGANISANVASATIRYVSNSYIDPAFADWPEKFAQLVGAYLAFLVAERVTGERGSSGRMSQLFSSLLPAAQKSDAVPDNVWLIYQRSGAWLSSVRQLLTLAPWRFAMVDAAISAHTGTPAPGFAFSFAKPSDWLATYRLFLTTGTAPEVPFDIREIGGFWSSSSTAFAVRYVGTVGLDATLWPPAFDALVLSYLEAGMPDVDEAPKAKQGQGQEVSAWRQALASAAAIEAEPADPFLPHQLDGSLAQAARDVLRQGAWKFAVAEAALVTSGSPPAGFSASYAMPADFLRTIALFQLSTASHRCPLDIRETGALFLANPAAAIAVICRYVSKAASTSPLIWTQSFVEALRAWFHWVDAAPPEAPNAYKLFEATRDRALVNDGEEPDPWLRYQLNGAYVRARQTLLTLAPWRFAMVDALISVHTGTPTQGMAFSFAKPADWLQTYRLFLTGGAAPEAPFDIRQTAGFWSSSSTAFSVRYVSTIGINATLWPQSFETAVLAYLDAGMPPIESEQPSGSTPPAAKWQQALVAAIAVAAEPPDPLLPHQLDGSLAQGARDVLAQGAWRFAIAEATLVSSGTPLTGFARSYPMPADLLRTLALFLISASGRRCPLDIRKTGTVFGANPLGVRCRFVSKLAATSPLLWVQSFIETLRAWFRLRDADEQSAPVALKRYETIRDTALIGDGEEPDPWLAFQLSGAFGRVARTMTDEAYWRFAMKTVHIIAANATGTGDGGYAHAYRIPADWSRTRQLYRLAPDGRRMPLDIREAGTHWHTDALDFYAQYISETLALDATLWPDHYMRACLRQLQYDEDIGEEEAGESEGEGAKEAQVTAPGWKDALAATTDSEADEPDPWLMHQLTGAYRRAKQDVLDSGFWRFALTEVQYSSETDQVATAADYVLPYTFARPADWYRTHALFVPWDGQDCPVNAREVGTYWTTDAETFVARYVATTVLDETLWPEPLAKAVLSRLDWVTAPPEKAAPLFQTYEKFLADAQAAHARPPDEWLRFQIDGSFRQAVKMLLEEGRWRFAVRTVVLEDSSDPLPAWLADGTPSDGYRYRFIQPNDSLRTLQLYFRQGDASYTVMNTIDFRDEGDSFSANYTPVVCRYVSRFGFDATKWSPHFRNATLAWLQYNEARADPRMASVAAERLKAYQTACADAQALDDERDVPQRRYSGKFVRGRYGRGTLDFEQAWTPGALF